MHLETTRFSFARILAVLFSLLILCAPALAAEYFVSPAGNDANPGTAAAHFRSIARSVITLRPGDTLNIGPGTYRESVIVALRGAADARVTIRGAGLPVIEATGDFCLSVLDSSYLTIEGIKFTSAARAAVHVAQSHHVTIEGCLITDNALYGIETTLSDYVSVSKSEITNSKSDALLFSSTDHPGVLDCTIRDNAASGIRISGAAAEGGDGVVSGANLARNKIISNSSLSGAAISLDGVEKSTIEKNVCDKNLSGGIVSFKEAAAKAGSGNFFQGNVVTFETGVGLYGIKLADGSFDSRLEQNTIVIDNGPAVYVDKASAKKLAASFNFYVTLGAPVSFSYKGLILDFAAWKDATGQDADSHVTAASSTPGGK